MLDKRGQLAIWVILAIILVASMLLLFVFKFKPEILKPAQTDVVFDMQSFLDSCTKKAVNEAVDKMLPQGGFVAPKNALFFNQAYIEYLCENIGFYEPCIQQHPMLLNEMKQEIRNYIFSEIASCFSQMEKEYEKRAADISFGGRLFLENIDIDLGLDKIFVNIKRNTVITKQNETRIFDNFNIEVQSPLYNLATIAMEIASQEARFCYFEFVGYKIIYPRYTIKKYETSRLSKVYTIIDKKSGKEMNIAIRSCAIPAGF